MTRDKVIPRDHPEISNYYNTMIESENHHDDEIILDESGVPRWRENPIYTKLSDEIGLNEIVIFFLENNITKNHENWRRFFRGIGYSLSGYEEIFYWDGNNPNIADYKKDGLLDEEIFINGIRI